MLSLPSAESAANLRAFFEESGYSRANLIERFGPMETSRRRGRNRQDLLQITAEPTLLNILYRWFALGLQVPPEPAKERIPSGILEEFFAAGFLRLDDDRALPGFYVEPANGMLFCSDVEPVETLPEENFVPNYSLSSQMMVNFALEGTFERGLDLGCGSGILTLPMAQQCARVVATDVNPRALEYTAYNARLNGFENIEVRQGSGFEPVEGETFDWILSNPPFFMSPKVTTVFSMSGYLLDGFCAMLAREAHKYLNEGAIFQFLGEWIRREGQEWTVRPNEWFAGAGCDVWALKLYEMSADRYTATRMVVSTEASAQEFADSLAEWRKPFVENSIAAVDGAFVLMRKRSGPNWLALDDQAVRPDAVMRHAAKQAVEARDYLFTHGDPALILDSVVEINPGARLETTAEPGGGEWRQTQSQMYLTDGARQPIEVNPQVAAFLASFDGDLNVAEVIEAMAAATALPVAQIQGECINMVRRFVERGYLLPKVAAAAAKL